MNLRMLFAGLVLLPSLAYATVGGPQSIEVLGYDAPDQKLYILRHFYDGRGRLPQLSYYLLGSPQSQQQIDVTSLYLNPQTQQVDFDQDPTQFNQALAKIQSRLQKLEPIPTTQLKLEVLVLQQQHISFPMEPSRKLLEYQYCYQVHYGKMRSPFQDAVSYQANLQLSQAYRIPQQQQVLAVVKYQGIAMEGGYSVEDAVIFK